MISTNVTGAAAYAAIQNGTVSASTAEIAPEAAGPSNLESFSTALQGALTNLTDAGHTADAKSVEAMKGKGNLTDVVMAVSKAEMALQTSVAVRDRVISAYQDIMRMAV